MKPSLKNQSGFALPLLIMLLLIGAISGMVASSVANQQVRNARTLDSAVRARLAAESGGAFMVNAFNDGTYSFGTGGPFAGEDLGHWGGDQLRQTKGGDYWRLASISFAAQTTILRVIGTDAAETTSREIEIAFTNEEQPYSAFESAVVSCRGTALGGSGRIDSYDSREGGYQEHKARSNADVSILDGDLKISGHSPLMGRVSVNGDVEMTSSNTVGGNIEATGNITLDGGGAQIKGDLRANGRINLNNTDHIHGSVHAKNDVTFNNGAKVYGDLHTEGSLTLANSGARIDGISRVKRDLFITQDITCNLSQIRYGGKFGGAPGNNWCTGAGQTDFMVHDPSIGNVTAVRPPTADDCDPLDVTSQTKKLRESSYKGIGTTNQYSSGNATNNIVDNTHFINGLNLGGQSANQLNIHSGSVDQIYVDKSLSVGGSATLRIKAPSSGSGRVLRIFVNGDVNMGGDGNFEIEKGAAVEIYTTGKINLGASIKNNNSSPTTIINRDGKSVVVPSLSFYSSHDEPNGVEIGGWTNIFASIYAPLTDVTMTGSGSLYGAARGKKVVLSGSGAIHYDEALSEYQESAEGATGQPRITSWTEIL